jgi:hypothetical protein
MADVNPFEHIPSLQQKDKTVFINKSSQIKISPPNGIKMIHISISLTKAPKSKALL